MLVIVALVMATTHEDDDHDDLQTWLDFTSGYQGNLTATGITITQLMAVAGVAGGDETAAEVLACTYIKNAVNVHEGDAWCRC